MYHCQLPESLAPDSTVSIFENLPILRHFFLLYSNMNDKLVRYALNFFCVHMSYMYLSLFFNDGLSTKKSCKNLSFESC